MKVYTYIFDLRFVSKYESGIKVLPILSVMFLLLKCLTFILIDMFVSSFRVPFFILMGAAFTHILL